MMPFGLADTLSSTLDLPTFALTVWITAREMVGNLLIGELMPILLQWDISTDLIDYSDLIGKFWILYHVIIQIACFANVVLSCNQWNTLNPCTPLSDTFSQSSLHGRLAWKLLVVVRENYLAGASSSPSILSWDPWTGKRTIVSGTARTVLPSKSWSALSGKAVESVEFQSGIETVSEAY